MSGLEIERKFLLKFLPPEVLSLRSTSIFQGYLASDEHKEVRIRQQGSKHFLTVKEGSGLVRTEVEIAISAGQFCALWPTTVGRRLEKTRTAFRHEGYRLEIDRYQGELEPLVIGEVEFPTVEASEEFQKPSFFGREVTNDESYRNVALAIHGAPHGSALKYELGALPYLFRGGRLHVVIVTNSDQTKWIIPKGQPEPDMSRQDVAIMEAMEEAGIIGTFHPGLRAGCRRKGEKTLYVYPLKVTTVLKKWPEMDWRKRAVVPLSKALKMISDPDLAQCVERLATKLGA